jgi:hypothetical protein
VLKLSEFRIDRHNQCSTPPGNAAAPPWRLTLVVDVWDLAFPSRLENEAFQRVDGPLSLAVAAWQESDPDLARAKRLTGQLDEVDARLKQVAENIRGLASRLEAALCDWKVAGDIDARLANAKSEKSFLEGRRLKLIDLATVAKDAAEASLRRAVGDAAKRLCQDAKQGQSAAGVGVFDDAAAAVVAETVVADHVVRMAARRDIADQFVPAALAGVRPDGYSLDRRWAAAIPAGSDNRYAAVN